jgi:hypothetical protein
MLTETTLQDAEEILVRPEEIDIEALLRLGEYIDNHALVVVERNNHGSGILAYLESPCAYPHIFAQNGQPGFLTTSLSRPAMLGRLGAALVEEPDRFLSRRLLEECRSFVRLPNGSSGARAGMHDDRVLAMAIALAAREQSLVVRD